MKKVSVIAETMDPVYQTGLFTANFFCGSRLPTQIVALESGGCQFSACAEDWNCLPLIEEGAVMVAVSEEEPIPDHIPW